MTRKIHKDVGKVKGWEQERDIASGTGLLPLLVYRSFASKHTVFIAHVSCVYMVLAPRNQGEWEVYGGMETLG